jgi:hypothetical protein
VIGDRPQSGLSAAEPIGLDELNAGAALLRRVDTKYLIGLGQLDGIADHLADTHRRLTIGGVSTFAYRTRYLDTAALTCFHAHRQGRRSRYKIRTRCYDDTGLCRFEVKVKDGRGATDKYTRDIPADEFGAVSPVVADFVADVLGARYGIAAPVDLTPTLLVAHHRVTLTGRDESSRVTVDTGVTFRAGTAVGVLRPGVALVETKSPRGRCHADVLLRRAGAHPVNVSKYCAGMALTQPYLPEQPWRPVLRRYFTVAAPVAVGRAYVARHGRPEAG